MLAAIISSAIISKVSIPKVSIPRQHSRQHHLKQQILPARFAQTMSSSPYKDGEEWKGYVSLFGHPDMRVWTRVRRVIASQSPLPPREFETINALKYKRPNTFDNKEVFAFHGINIGDQLLKNNKTMCGIILCADSDADGF